MRTPPRTTRKSRTAVLLATLAALFGLVVLGGLAPATAQAESARAAADTSGGTTGGTTGGSFGGTTTTGGSAAGTTTTGGSTAGTTTVGGSTGDPGAPVYPTDVGAPTVVQATPTSVTLTWTAPVDDVPITRYEVWADFGEGAGGFAVSTTNTVTVTDLHPGYTWNLYVIAWDASYRYSFSPEVVVRTPALPATTCSVGYRVVQDWGSGFQAEITVPNPGTADISNWDLAFVWAPRQDVTNMWGGTFTQTTHPLGFTQSGSTVTVTPAGYTSVIPAGGSVTIGFTGTAGLMYPPYFFTLNGTLCATATG